MERINEARQALLDVSVNLKTEEIPVEEAYGRVAAEHVIAGTAVPAFRRSAYDGYAIRSQDIREASRENPVTLKVTERIPAGSIGKHPVTEGTAARIMTGAKVPVGADTVVKHEDTWFTDTQVRFFMPASGGNVVEPGEDVEQGICLMEPGKVIGAADAAVMAGQGMSRVRVFRKPEVGIISTGSELVRRGKQLPEGMVYDTNPLLLAGYMRSYGMMPREWGIVPDETKMLADSIGRALAVHDMVITTGGVSAGDFDYVPKAVERIGARILFHGLPFKPGGAMLAAVKDGKVILGLSGNPGAAAVGMLYVGLPYMKKLCGRSSVYLTKAQAVLSEPFGKSSRGIRILRGSARIQEGRLMFDQMKNQRNGAVWSVMDCSLLGEVPAGNAGLLAGETIDVYFL